jgi:hypothetical protein
MAIDYLCERSERARAKETKDYAHAR